MKKLLSLVMALCMVFAVMSFASAEGTVKIGMVTDVGGVNDKNAGDFIKAGCVGVGVGGNLVNKEWIENGEWDRITDLAKAYMEAVRV